QGRQLQGQDRAHAQPGAADPVRQRQRRQTRPEAVGNRWAVEHRSHGRQPGRPAQARKVGRKPAGAQMMRNTLPALTAAVMALGLSACALQPPAVATGGGITEQAGQFEFALPSGDYRCERGERLQLRREMANAVNYRMQLAWNGGNYQLERDPSYS